VTLCKGPTSAQLNLNSGGRIDLHHGLRNEFLPVTFRLRKDHVEHVAEAPSPATRKPRENDEPVLEISPTLTSASGPRHVVARPSDSDSSDRNFQGCCLCVRRSLSFGAKEEPRLLLQSIRARSQRGCVGSGYDGRPRTANSIESTLLRQKGDSQIRRHLFRSIV
jgi:hypothetical protein